MMWWQWHQLDHMQIVCTSLQTDNLATDASTSPGQMPFLPPNQQRQSTEGNQGILFVSYDRFISLSVVQLDAAQYYRVMSCNSQPLVFVCLEGN